MKRLLFFSIVITPIIFAFIVADNPLRNTKWTGESGVALYFTPTDTVKLMINDRVISSALYKVKDSTLTWRDFIVSENTCDTSIRGTYIYKISEDVLKFRVLSDRCEDRANVIQTLVLIKQ